MFFIRRIALSLALVDSFVTRERVHVSVCIDDVLVYTLVCVNVVCSPLYECVAGCLRFLTGTDILYIYCVFECVFLCESDQLGEYIDGRTY